MAKSSKSQRSKRVFKGNQEFEHVLFKSDVRKCKKNMSWKKYEPRIEEFEHRHVFHSRNSKGKPQAYTTPTAGHFHQVEFEAHEENGEIYYSATCGPALRRHTKRLKTGKWATVIEPVVFEADGEQPDVVDDHSHDLEYCFTELLSPHRRQEQQHQDGKRLSEIQGAVDFVHKPQKSKDIGDTTLEEV